MYRATDLAFACALRPRNLAAFLKAAPSDDSGRDNAIHDGAKRLIRAAAASNSSPC
jgi:hypothetical protein